MKKKFFLHLGFHKTATTYIQKVLGSVQHTLQSAGFYYNELNNKPGHEDIAHKIKQNYLEGNINAKGYLAEYAKQLKIPEKSELLIPIFSSEVLTDCPVNIISDELKLISKEHEVNIIITIRDILDQAKSLFQEQLKWGQHLQFSSLEDWLKVLEMNDLSLPYSFEIINLCQKNNYKLHVIKVSTSNNPVDVLSSFAKVTGISEHILYESEFITKTQNKSYDPFSQIMLEKLNLLFSKSGKDSIDFISRNRLANNALNSLKNAKDIQIENIQKVISDLNQISAKSLTPPEIIEKVAKRNSETRDRMFMNYCQIPNNGSWNG